MYVPPTREHKKQKGREDSLDVVGKRTKGLSSFARCCVYNVYMSRDVRWCFDRTVYSAFLEHFLSVYGAFMERLWV